MKVPTLPTLHKQRVIVNSGGREGSTLVGKIGIVKQILTDTCVVLFEDSTQVTLKKIHLHCLEQCDEQPTVKLNPIKRIEASDFPSWLREYLEQTLTQLLDVPNEECFQRSITEFKRKNNLKSPNI